MSAAILAPVAQPVQVGYPLVVGAQGGVVLYVMRL
jgi:hypothetical protein